MMHKPALLSDDTYLIKAFKVLVDPSTLYYHEAMRCDNRAKFREAVNKELISQIKNRNFKVIPRLKLLPETKILLIVW